MPIKTYLPQPTRCLKTIKNVSFQNKMDDSLESSINDTEEDYIYEYDLDESLATFNWSELGPSLFVFSVTFIVGILGNSLILVAVLRHTHVKSSPVNVFLASLASADLLLILVCLPLKVRFLLKFTFRNTKLTLFLGGQTVFIFVDHGCCQLQNTVLHAGISWIHQL